MDSRWQTVLRRVRLSALILVLVFSVLFAGRYLLTTDIEYRDYQPFRAAIDDEQLDDGFEELQRRFAQRVENIPRFIAVENREFVVVVSGLEGDGPTDPFDAIRLEGEEAEYESIAADFLDANPFALNVVGEIDNASVVEDVQAWYAREESPTEEDARNLIVERQRREHGIYESRYGTHWSEVSKNVFVTGLLPPILFFLLAWPLARLFRVYWNWVSGRT